MANKLRGTETMSEFMIDPPLTSTEGHQVTHIAHRDCDQCVDCIEQAATIMAATGCRGGTHETREGVEVHGATVVRAISYVGEYSFNRPPSTNWKGLLERLAHDLRAPVEHKDNEPGYMYAARENRWQGKQQAAGMIDEILERGKQ